MRLFPLVALSNVLLGSDLSLPRVAPTSKSMLFPKLNKLHEYTALSADRRRSPTGVSDQCISDMDSDSVWCIHPEVSCDVLGNSHTKWVIHIDNDIEHMCYPSSCSGNDIESLYIWEMQQLNSAAKYCTLDCPAIVFNITGTSEDDQKMAISGMYNYADLSYDCAGAAAMVEISSCEETGTCPSDVNGLTTCTLYYEDRLTYAHLGMNWRVIGKHCLPDECTNKANLEKLEDFHYAWLTYFQREENGVYLTPEETRGGYLVEYVCPPITDGQGNRDDEGKEDKVQPSKEQTSSRNYSSYVLIFGVTSAVLFVLCLCAICMIRIKRGGGVMMTPTVSIELNNRETFATLCEVSTSSK